VKTLHIFLATIPPGGLLSRALRLNLKWLDPISIILIILPLSKPSQDLAEIAVSIDPLELRKVQLFKETPSQSYGHMGSHSVTTQPDISKHIPP